MDEMYINRCKAFIDFMISQQQWSGIGRKEVTKWIGNFRELDNDKQWMVYKLLTNVIYFSEKDVIDVLKDGVFQCVAYDSILESQRVRGFQLSSRALHTIYKKELSQVCFVPLLDSDSPHESGNYVSRLLVQQGIISSNQSMFIEKVPPLFKKGIVKKLVIVDDCVGSGHQLTGFWTTTKVFDEGEELTIKDLCQKYNVSANYLTLFGYDKSIEDLQSKFADLKIHCVRTLSEQQRVFADVSYIWKDLAERDEVLKILSELCKTVGIPVLGYNSLDFAFIMHQTIPDWSLPLFWKENDDWSLLVRRKNSNV